MLVSDLKQDQIKVGLKIKAQTSTAIGEVVDLNYADGDAEELRATVAWPDGSATVFFGNRCKCEVVE